MFLSQQAFSEVIERTPLVSIDLVVEDEQGKFLLGERLNRPAKDFWFVAGGRIRKDETIEAAFERLTLVELGTAIPLSRATLKGPFTHFYDDCVFGEDVSTHYVAIAYHVKVERGELLLPLDVQHGSYQWFDKRELLESEQVHRHTKWYFS